MHVVQWRRLICYDWVAPAMVRQWGDRRIDCAWVLPSHRRKERKAIRRVVARSRHILHISAREETRARVVRGRIRGGSRQGILSIIHAELRRGIDTEVRSKSTKIVVMLRNRSIDVRINHVDRRTLDVERRHWWHLRKVNSNRHRSRTRTFVTSCRRLHAEATLLEHCEVRMRHVIRGLR